MLAPDRTVAPAADVLALEDVKAHLRVDADDEDVLIAGLIEAASAHLDGYAGTLGRCLVNQTWTQSFAGFGSCLRLPLAPVSSLTSVTYYDGDNASQTLASSVYQLLTDALGPKVVLKPDQSWPGTYGREDAVTVTFVAGYGASGSDVPGGLRHAMLLMICDWYESRSNAIFGATATRVPISMATEALLAPYRRVGF